MKGLKCWEDFQEGLSLSSRDWMMRAWSCVTTRLGLLLLKTSAGTWTNEELQQAANVFFLDFFF